MAIKQVGHFSFDETDGTVSGPESYMKDWGNTRLRSIEAGNDVVVSMGYQQNPNVDIITLILVSLQTDYAAWKGLQTLGLDGRS